MPIERFIWTQHAEERLRDRNLAKDLVEQAIREGHPMRQINKGEADWRLVLGRFVVIYDHPDGDDIDAVRVVSVWTRRRGPRPDLVTGYPL
jgi:hypothetical protein